MRAWEYGVPFGPNIFMAEGVIELDLLWILMSEFDKSQKETNLGIKVSCCAGGMSAVIMGAEHVVEPGWVI